MNAKRIIITTSNHPSTWYKWEGRENQEAAVKRRFVDFGYIMANTSEGLDKVDPEDFWPIQWTKLPRKVYKKKTPMLEPTLVLDDLPDEDIPDQVYVPMNRAWLHNPATFCKCLIDYGADCLNCHPK